MLVVTLAKARIVRRRCEANQALHNRDKGDQPNHAARSAQRTLVFWVGHRLRRLYLGAALSATDSCIIVVTSAIAAGFHRGVCKWRRKLSHPPTRGVNRDSGTDNANGGWLRRLVGGELIIRILSGSGLAVWVAAASLAQAAAWSNNHNHTIGRRNPDTAQCHKGSRRTRGTHPEERRNQDTRRNFWPSGQTPCRSGRAETEHHPSES